MNLERSTVQPFADLISTPDERAENHSVSITSRPRRVGGGLLDLKLLWRSLPDALRKSIHGLCGVIR
jgi:hypothetical protein